MPCRSGRGLDLLLGMEYQASCNTVVAKRIAEPREASFVVVERLDYRCVERGRWTLYLLVKRGVDTLTALEVLEKKAGVRRGSAIVAGFKDAAATTVQYAALPVDAGPLVRHSLGRGRVVAAKRLCRVNAPPHPSRLRGNTFTIVLELAESASLQEVGEAAERLKSLLIPAYYGYQRFGTIRPITHLLGAAALYDDPETYLSAVLDQPYPDEAPEAIASRLVRRGVARGYETLVRRASRLSVGDAITATRSYLRGLDLEALQALAFNLYVSERIRQGIPLDEPVAGERIGREGLPIAVVPGKGFTPGKTSRRIYEEALARIGVRLEDMVKMPSKGFWRPVAFRVEELQWRLVTRDGKRFLVLRFTLPRGMYATIVLRELAATPY